MPWPGVAAAGEVRGVTASPAPTGPAVEIRDLRMRYGDRDVLRGVELEIQRGECLALLGPNGAGKTTTIEVLEGFRHRSDGHVRVLGEDPATAPEAWRARLGIVIQQWRDHGRFRPLELLEHLRRFYDDPRGAAETLELVGLGDQGTQPAGKLSGGQRRRLDVAMAILGRPDLLLLDEPTGGFDPAARHDFHELLRRLVSEEEVTVLLTTHDLAEAERLADRIAILVDGRVVRDATAGDLAASLGREAEVRWRDERGRHAVRTEDPGRLVRELPIDVEDLEVRRATLEDVYLRTVREDEVTA
jgi:ABC-2 type transport system ATP-binding protein